MAFGPSAKDILARADSESHAPSVEITPAKRKASPQYLEATLNEKAYSTPNLLGSEKRMGGFEMPDRPNSHKRAKSTSERPGIPGSCKRKFPYRYESARIKHVRDCLDPICGQQLPLNQDAILDENPISFDLRKQMQEHSSVIVISDDEDASLPVDDDGDDVNNASREAPLPNATDEGPVRRTGAPHANARDANQDCNQESNAQDFDVRPSPSNWRSKGDRTPSTISQMHGNLRKILSDKLTPGERKGRVYIMRDKKRPHLCKIGRSVDSDKRAASIRRACEIDCEEVFGLDVDRYTRTELLVHAYLSDLRQPYRCTNKSCNRVHDEWFVISTEAAISAVERWVQFMNQHDPYDIKSMELNPFWSLWLKAHRNPCTDTDADLVRARWNAILSPSTLDWSRVWVVFVQGIVKKFFWPMFATLGWTMTFVTVRHPVAFSLMAMSVVGTFFSMTRNAHLLRDISGKFE
jgi:hypothetical protein